MTKQCKVIKIGRYSNLKKGLQKKITIFVKLIHLSLRSESKMIGPVKHFLVIYLE